MRVQLFARAFSRPRRSAPSPPPEKPKADGRPSEHTPSSRNTHDGECGQMRAPGRVEIEAGLFREWKSHRAQISQDTSLRLIPAYGKCGQIHLRPKRAAPKIASPAGRRIDLPPPR